MSTAIVICSRSKSVRLPDKAFIEIQGKPILEHLIDRLLPLKLPIYLAVPHCDFDRYRKLVQKKDSSLVTLFCGSENDPLFRMSCLTTKYGIDTVIRINHDKIFIDPSTISDSLALMQSAGADYVHPRNFIDGAGFEIISSNALTDASSKFKNVEHIGYAIQCVTDKIETIEFPALKSKHRFLIDYPEDLRVMEILFSQLGPDCQLRDVIAFMDKNPWVAKINRLPLVSFYTCAHNAEKFIYDCMGSVASQSGFHDCEYILIDDASTDGTLLCMAEFSRIYRYNTQWYSNPVNQGLATSSNIALSRARGKYIMRVDADDYLVSKNIMNEMVLAIEERELDILYPDNFFGSMSRVQKGAELNHVGGALFRTKAANHVKFTDGLRGYEGYDFFTRARTQVKYGYYERPTFFYRQHPGSLSKQNLKERARIKEGIDGSQVSPN